MTERKKRLKKAAALKASLTVNETEHLERRHARHVKAWHTTDWKMELPKDDRDFIEGLRASRRPVIEVTANKFWE